MTPSVVRNGQIKSAMFLRTECLLPLTDPENKCFAQAFHLLYHECAHMDSYGSWPSLVLFERIGTLAEKVVEANGVSAKVMEDVGVVVKVPFTLDTHHR